MRCIGPTQGMAFFKYVLQECDNRYVEPDNYTAEFGIKPEMGFELVYYYPDSIPAFPQFWISKPEVRK